MMVLDILAEGRISANEAAEILRMLRRPESGQKTAPRLFRLCFRLEEPAEEGEFWLVRYMLQDLADPSLLLEARGAYVSGVPGAELLGPKVRGALEDDLERAGGICPRLRAERAWVAEGGCVLAAQEAYVFFTEAASALEGAGFGVMLPGWCLEREPAKELKARLRITSDERLPGSGLVLKNIVAFDWEVALGDQVLDEEELKRLASLKAPILSFRGHWIEVRPGDIERARRLWSEKRCGQVTAGQAIARVLEEGEEAAAVVGGWVGDLLSELTERNSQPEPPLPQGFQGELRPYQRRGYAWLDFMSRWGLGACLADDMGLGKTPQTLALLQRRREEGEQRPALVVCPTSVVGNWQREAARFAPDLSVMVHHGMGRTRGEIFREKAERQALVITTYALLPRDLECLRSVAWSGLVLDEAQNIKNWQTKQARAARALPAAYRLALTGTPVENNVGDLWSIMDFLNPGFLGSRKAFHKAFYVPIQGWGDTEATERLKRRTAPFVLRRLKTDPEIATDLPEKMEMSVHCNLTKEQVSLYQAVVDESMQALAAAAGIQRRGIVLATLSKLRQVCNHPAQFLKDHSRTPGRSGKLERFTEMLEEVHSVGDRALIFSQFYQMGKILVRHLEEVWDEEVLFLHGGTPKSQRDAMIERFQIEEEAPSFFVLSLKAGGTGLNLTRATHVFHYDRWWNPAVENQATDRAFRIGQERNVQVYKALCAGTVEEKVDEIVARKRELAERVVGEGEAWLTELSTAELKELFTLDKDVC